MMEVTFCVMIEVTKRKVTEKRCNMTLSEFLKNYGNNACISIEGYCEEERYDYVALPSWVQDEDDMAEFEAEELSGNNPNHYIPSCLFKEPWWDKVKDREVVHWNIIGGGMYKVELCIELGKERQHE